MEEIKEEVIETKEHTKFYEESPGVTSAKRVWGSILLGAGAALLFGVGVMGFWKIVPGASDTISAAQALIVVGGILLGFGMLSVFGKK